MRNVPTYASDHTSSAEDHDWLDHCIASIKAHPPLWIGAGLIALVIIVLTVTMLTGTQPLDTDPTVAGRPLSNPDQHIHALALAPTQPGGVYIGSHYGLFISHTDGHSWPQARGILNTLMILSLAPNPVDPRTVALAGIAPSGGDFGQNGLYVTHDGSQTWQRMADPAGLPIDTQRYLIAADGPNPTHWLALYVGAGLYQTTNDGHSWRRLRAPTSDQESQRVIWVDPTDPQTIMLGTNTGLQRTHNGGTQWQTVADITGGIYAIVVSPAAPQQVIVAADDGIYRSQDGGTTFRHLSNLVAVAPFARLAISSQHAQLVYGLVGQQVWRSQDGGATWTQQCTLQDSYPMSLLVAPNDDQHLYVGFYTPAVAVESTNGGQTWQIIAS